MKRMKKSLQKEPKKKPKIPRSELAAAFPDYLHTPMYPLSSFEWTCGGEELIGEQARRGGLAIYLSFPLIDFILSLHWEVLSQPIKA